MIYEYNFDKNVYWACLTPLCSTMLFLLLNESVFAALIASSQWYHLVNDLQLYKTLRKMSTWACLTPLCSTMLFLLLNESVFAAFVSSQRYHVVNDLLLYKT
jgi:hypothetical protein